MSAAEPYDCAVCGRRIGKLRPHFILDDGRVVCVRDQAEFYDAGRIVHEFCTRASAARLLRASS